MPMAIRELRRGQPSLTFAFDDSPMRIGLICRADGAVARLPKDWRPRPLGARSVVVQDLQDLSGSRFDGRTVSVETESGVLELSVGEADPVESVSVRALLSSDAIDLLRRICERFGARYYDSEQGDFIDL
jgi:hypothetical protein